MGPPSHSGGPIHLPSQEVTADISPVSSNLAVPSPPYLNRPESSILQSEPCPSPNLLISVPRVSVTATLKSIQNPLLPSPTQVQGVGSRTILEDFMTKKSFKSHNKALFLCPSRSKVWGVLESLGSLVFFHPIPPGCRCMLGHTHLLATRAFTRAVTKGSGWGKTLQNTEQNLGFPVPNLRHCWSGPVGTDRSGLPDDGTRLHSVGSLTGSNLH